MKFSTVTFKLSIACSPKEDAAKSRMQAGRKQVEQMSTVAKPDALLQVRRVYHQNGEAAALLPQLGSSFEAVALPGRFTADDSNPCVVIGENPAVFTPELREAIERNSARLLYVLGPGSELPAEAGRTPVFSFLTSPLQRMVVESSLNAAFENLLLTRNQAVLQL